VRRPGRLDEIHAQLANNAEPGVALWAAAAGHGGQGKSILAIGYAHAQRAAYPGGCLWLACETAQPVTALATLASACGLTRAMKEQAAAEAVRDFLAAQPPCLLILDNIADEAQWRAWRTSHYLPGGNCRLLVTTRRRGLAQLNEVRVGRLDPPEAVELLCRFRPFDADSPEAQAAAHIAHHVDYLAVAVAAIGVRVKRTAGATYAGYWTELRENPALAMPETDAADQDHLGYDGRISELIDAAVASLRPAERRALQYAALLPEDLVPKTWLIQLIEQDAAVTPPAAVGAEGGAAGGVIAGLLNDDILLFADDDKRLLSLHRLWAMRIRMMKDLRGSVVVRLLELLKVRIGLKHAMIKSIGACAQSRRAELVGTHADGTDRGVDNPAILMDATLRWELTPLAATCVLMWDRPAAVAAAARLGQWLGPLLLQSGRLNEAHACLAPTEGHEAGVIDALGATGLATSYSNLALILQALGDLPAARARMERAIEILEKALPPDHPTLATSYSNLALILKDLGDLPAARARMERAIEIFEKALPPGHTHLATCYSNLAMILKDLGELPAARARMERAIGIEEKAFAPDHPTLATSYHNLADIAFDEGKPRAALALEERALAIWRKHFDDQHPHVKLSERCLAKYRKAADRAGG
jgi:hypothetical protein